jgi:hypothetical protein
VTDIEIGDLVIVKRENVQILGIVAYIPTYRVPWQRLERCTVEILAIDPEHGYSAFRVGEKVSLWTTGMSIVLKNADLCLFK